jgi:outer membrane receptor protein involved in Fe transport
VEAEASWHRNGLTLAGNLTYDKAYTRDAIASVGALAGDALPYSPRWSGAASIDYDFAGFGGVTPSIGASVRHTGAQQAYYSQATGTNPGDLRLPSYTFLDLRAGIRWEKWQLSVFAQNVTDKHAILTLTTEQANPLTNDDARATIARPRTVGATLGFRF